MFRTDYSIGAITTTILHIFQKCVKEEVIDAKYFLFIKTVKKNEIWQICHSQNRNQKINVNFIMLM
jgi:hypothetical protein